MRKGVDKRLWVCYNNGKGEGSVKERKAVGMMSVAHQKELRNIIFMAVAIVLAFIVSITSIMGGQLLGIVVSMALLGMLCVGLGYLYCKSEDRLFVAQEKVSYVATKTVAEFKDEENSLEVDSEKCAD